MIIEEYVKRLTTMQDEIYKEVLKANQSSSSDAADMIKEKTQDYFNSYVSMVHSTSASKLVERFKIYMIDVTLYADIPQIFLSSKDGIKIAKECMSIVIDNFEESYEKPFDNLKNSSPKGAPEAANSIHKKIRNFVHMIEHLKQNSNIYTILEPKQAQRLESAFGAVCEKFLEIQSNVGLSQSETDYGIRVINEAITKMEKILPIPLTQERLLNKKNRENLANSNEINNINKEDRKFSI